MMWLVMPLSSNSIVRSGELRPNNKNVMKGGGNLGSRPRLRDRTTAELWLS